MCVIFLKCINGEGYYTGTCIGATGKEVCVHPQLKNAKKFDTWEYANKVIKALRRDFPCICGSFIREY